MEYLKINYHFDANLWRYSGKGGWYFVTLPRSLSDHIKMAHGCSQSSWGRLKVNVTVSSDKWTTSLWYDTKLCSYLLPIKAAIRQKNLLEVDHEISINIEIIDGLQI